MFRFGICLKGLFYFITLGGGCGSPSSTEVATRRGAREFRLAPTKLISHEILMISQDLTSDVFFLGGILASPPITHHHFSGTYRLHRTSEKSKHIKLDCSADTFCKFLLDGWFVRFAAHFLLFRWCHLFCFAKTLPKKQISNDFRCGFPRRVQLTSKEQLVKTQLSLDLRPCRS